MELEFKKFIILLHSLNKECLITIFYFVRALQTKFPSGMLPSGINFSQHQLKAGIYIMQYTMVRGGGMVSLEKNKIRS